MDLKYINKENVRLIQETKKHITFSFLKNEKNISVTKDILNNECLIVSEINGEDGIIAIIETNKLDYYVHIRNNNVYVTPYLNNHSEKSIDLKVNVLYEQYQVVPTKYSYKVLDGMNNTYEIDYQIFIGGSNEIEGLSRTEEEPNVYIKLQYGNCIAFIEYKKSVSSYLLRTLYVSVLYNKIDLDFTALSNNKIKLKGISNATIKRSRLHKEKEIIIKAKKNISKFTPILLLINRKSYLIEYVNEKEIRLSNDIRIELLVESAKFKSRKTSKGILFEGNIVHKHNNFKVDSIVSKDGKKLATIEWKSPRRAKFLIPTEKLVEFTNVHNTLYTAYKNRKMYVLHQKSDKEIVNRFLCIKNTNDYTYISRINLADNYSITAIPKSPLYTGWHQFKIKMASKMAPFVKKFKPENINLFFEKDASAANESGFVTFERVKEYGEIRSINKYVLDSTNEKYDLLKEKYGKDILKRFSFKHYLYIFLSSNFISSELSNHVVSVRIFDNLLLEKIRQTPLYFLQHGIMFAKPVDNPMALGFHKENQTNNLMKSVISSDLEAKEFYKMGYSDEDLMKTGLPKLDISRLNPEADKIAFMPTWRYWEEGSIVKGDIENTTYYKALIECISAFENAGLLDRLLIVPHNKFGEFIKENFDSYKDIISTNPTEALKQSVIFITDYSSAIYDATYRGAYPIFYWSEKDYLIKNYKAIPPVNEENAPGKIATSPEELIQIVREAIATNYIIPEEIQQKYLRVNEFNDNQNTDRVIKELKKLDVL